MQLTMNDRALASSKPAVGRRGLTTYVHPLSTLVLVALRARICGAQHAAYLGWL